MTARMRAPAAWLLLVTAVSLALRAASPPLVLANNSFDDLMFVRGAHSMLAGGWLGPFNGPRTLAKGVGYPLFLAFCGALRLPVLLAQHVLHLVAAASVAWLAYRLTRSRLLGVALYTALALDPSFFGTAASRILRDNFYASVSLLLLAVVARGLVDPRPAQETLPRGMLVRALAASALAGGLLGFYWVTREERPWLLPALVLLLAVRLCRLRPPSGASWRAVTLSPRTAQRVAGAALATATAAALVGGVTLANRHTYGVAVTNDVTEGEFARAYGQWQAVRAGPLRPYVPITRRMREAVYAVSPAAREIESAMETGSGSHWIKAGCSTYRICDDVAGGWIQWALRAALYSTGRYDAAPASQDYWRRVAGEIASACARRELTCRAVTPFMLPQPDTVHIGAWARSARDAARWLLGFHLGDITTGSRDGTSGGYPENWRLFADTVPGLPATLDAELTRERAFATHHGGFAVLSDLYRLIVPPLVLVAGLGYLVAALRLPRGRSAGRTTDQAGIGEPHLPPAGWRLPAVLGVAAGVALVSRVELLALVDATSFPASRTSYLLPASSLLLVATAVGIWLLVHTVRPAPRAVAAVPALRAAPSQEQGERWDPELSVVLPCLDEAATLETCIRKAMRSFAELDVDGEVVVADNGSTDASQQIARRCGARVVEVPTRGYGAALRGGIAGARGRYVIMADADDSYALDDLGPFLAGLRGGNDMVIGNRFQGGIEPGAMPPLHRYLGNPVLSLIGRLFFRIPVGDFHCGMRGFSRARALQVGLRSDGMEFASEIIVKFALSGARIAEVPTVLRRDGRDRPPHLRSWRDGWRHLRFLLLFSPRWLFLYPGVALAVAGALLMLRLSIGPVALGSAVLDTQSLLFSGAAVVVGVQAILLALLSRTYAALRGILPPSARLRATAHPRALERGLVLGGALMAVGLVGTVVAVLTWASLGFGNLDVAASMRLAVPAVTCLSVGAETLLASFFLGLLQLDQRISDAAAPALVDGEAGLEDAGVRSR